MHITLTGIERERILERHMQNLSQRVIASVIGRRNGSCELLERLMHVERKTILACQRKFYYRCGVGLNEKFKAHTDAQCSLRTIRH